MEKHICRAIQECIKVWSRASVQSAERRGEVKQAPRYRRNDIVVQCPAVYRGGWQKDTTPASSGDEEEGYKSYTGVRSSTRLASRQSAQTSRSEHTGREGSAYGELRAMRLLRVHDRCGCAGGRPRPMVGRGRPYGLKSAVVKLSRPIGIAVMALSFKYLQYTAAGGKPTPGGGVEWRRRGGGYKSYTGVRGSTHIWHRDKVQR